MRHMGIGLLQEAEEPGKVPSLRKAGFTKIPNGLWLDSRLSPGGRLVWAALKAFAFGNKSSCFPSVASIAEISGFSDRTVQKHLTRLQELGILRVRFRMRKSSTYTLVQEGFQLEDRTNGRVERNWPSGGGVISSGCDRVRIASSRSSYSHEMASSMPRRTIPVVAGFHNGATLHEDVAAVLPRRLLRERR